MGKSGWYTRVYIPCSWRNSFSLRFTVLTVTFFVNTSVNHSMNYLRYQYYMPAWNL